MSRANLTLDYQTTPGTVNAERSLADWGFEPESAEFKSMAESTITLRLPLQDPTTAPLIPFEGWVVLRVGRTGAAGAYTGGKVVFQGYRVYCDVEMSGSRAAHLYTFQDTWYALQQLCYQQVIGVGTAIGSNPTQLSYTNTYSSELNLFQGLASLGVGGRFIYKWTTGEQIADVIQYANLQRVPIQGGINGFQGYTGPTTIEPNVNVPIHQVKEMMCGEVLQNAMKTAPDAVVYFQHDDGSGGQVFPPRMWVRYIANCPAITLPVGNDGTEPWHMSTRLRERDELITPLVWLNYRTTGSVDAKVWVTVTSDIYPNDGVPTGGHFSGGPAVNPQTGALFTGRERGAVVQTFDFSGSAVTNFKGSIVSSWPTKWNDPNTVSNNVFGSASWPTGVANDVYRDRLAFWRKKQTQFMDANNTSDTYLNPGVGVPAWSKYQMLAIGSGWIEDSAGLFGPPGADITAYILSTLTAPGGQFPAGVFILEPGSSVQPWMQFTTWDAFGRATINQGLAFKVTIKCAVGYTEYARPADAAADRNRIKLVVPPHDSGSNRQGHEISVNVTLTNMPPGDYTAPKSSTDGEPVPTGLAQSIYNSLHQKQWDGSYVCKEKACSHLIGIGNALNLAPRGHTTSLPGWSTMRAMVQSVSFDYKTGTTTISVGPVKHLGPSDLIALYLFNRFRHTWRSPYEKESGQTGSGDETNISGQAGAENTTHLPQTAQETAVVLLGTDPSTQNTPRISSNAERLASAAPELLHL